MTRAWQSQTTIPAFESILGNPTLRLFRVTPPQNLRARHDGHPAGFARAVRCGIIRPPMKNAFLALCCLALLAACAGCGKPDPTAPAGTSADGPITNYPVRGVVQALRPDGKTVVIKHEQIPGFMDAMTMPFDVKDTNELRGLKPGDAVEFRMRVTEKDGWIDEVRVTSHGPAPHPATNAASALRILPDVPALNPGDLLPDYGFTNELGRSMRLSDLRGDAYAFTFIFTRGPFPDFCPRMSDRFATVQKRLTSDAAAPKNWRLLSVSFDPATDTPETLAGYGRRFGYDPSRWSLVSGGFDPIERLAGHFGLYFARDLPPADQNHNLRTVVVDAQGKVAQVFIGNAWSADELADAIIAAAKAK